MTQDKTPRKRGRPRIHPLPDPPEPATVLECTRGPLDPNPIVHRCSGELTDREALARFGLAGSRYTVARWPEGAPSEARVIHKPRCGG